MLAKQKICGNCFSATKEDTCAHCGYTASRENYDILPVGTVLNRRYIVGKLLGKGGFGMIYLSFDKISEKSVAVKEFYPNGIAVRTNDNKTVEPLTSYQSEDFYKEQERFFREAELIAKYRESAEIVGIYDVFRENGTAYYVMEFVKGISLKRYVEKMGNITSGNAVYIAKKILPSLAVLHDSNTLHRDVTPDNIMLGENGKVMLIDFGSARTVSEEKKELSVILKDGFAPIEQYQRNGVQDGRTDLYALGASLYFALTQAAPENPMLRSENDRAFLENLESTPPALREIICKASAIKPNDRYAKAEEMLSDLERCGIGEEEFDTRLLSDAEPIGAKTLPPRSAPKWKKKMIWLSIPILIAVCVSVFFLFTKTETGDEYEQMVKIGGEMYSVNSERLDLSNRELTNAQIANLRHMKKLVSLNINDNYITDLSCLAGLTELESLHFNNNNVSDLGFIRSMTHLKKISAENNSISDISVLSGMTELEHVFFGDNYVTDLTPLKNSRGLKSAGFNEAQIGDLSALEGMNELEMVCLAGCNLYDIAPLEQCDNLKFVYLGRNNLSDLSPLAGCEITELYIDNNRLSGHVESFAGITLNGFACVEGNGFSEEEIERMTEVLQGDFEIYY